MPGLRFAPSGPRLLARPNGEDVAGGSRPGMTEGAESLIIRRSVLASFFKNEIKCTRIVAIR